MTNEFEKYLQHNYPVIWEVVAKNESLSPNEAWLVAIAENAFEGGRRVERDQSQGGGSSPV